jgi:hypothetical protein
MTTKSCIILKNRGDITLESGVKSLLACRLAVKKLVKSTIFRGLTIKSIPDRIKTLLTTNKGLLYDNN